LSANLEAVEPFRKKLNDVIKNEGYQLSQIYNFDETGLFGRNLPDNQHEPGPSCSKD
jgi:hypothetical protein